MDKLNRLAELMFPALSARDTPEALERQYPPRELPEKAKVTRFAPSPTGSMHIGNLYGALAGERIAHSSPGGVFLLRIEDTDEKREVAGGVERIKNTLSAFGLGFDEGATPDGDYGAYGPYRQRARAKLYHIIAKKLLLEGRAYPCFCSEEELKSIRERQERSKENFGYYGKWAAHRDMPIEEAIAKIESGIEFVLRFRSLGDENKKIQFKDGIKGVLSFPENYQDFVLLKSDGIPTYHFAHVVDDHFMRTTDVIRGEEWLSTLPWHLELWNAAGFSRPRFAHTAQVLKLDEATGAKRKMSKRHDPESTVDFYFQAGYPACSVIEYLMTLLNSNYEQWRSANPAVSYREFPFSISKMGASGALFDLAKFNDVSKNVIALMTANEVYEGVCAWAKEYDPSFYAVLTGNPEYTKALFGIGRGGKKPRKDFARWSDVKPFVSFFYDELFNIEEPYPERISRRELSGILADYAEGYDDTEGQGAWFEDIKRLSERYGYASDMKAYKANPEGYKGSVVEVSTALRVAVTGRQNSPDLYAVCVLLGRERVLKRLQQALASIGEA